MASAKSESAGEREIKKEGVGVEDESLKEEIRTNLENIRRTVSSDAMDVMAQRPGPDTFLAALPQDIRDKIEERVESLKGKIRENEIPQSVKEHRTWDTEEQKYIVALQRVLDEEFPGWDNDEEYGYIRRFE
ncbi:hypothetical protein GF366_01550 [Candidatus Peregrinibacteria bacterium]|nr:hypothetical protein [Candidatus Peregrinibacteria bacterium]